MAGIAQIWILPDVLFSDLEFLTLSENEQRQRFEHVTSAVKAGDLEYLRSIPWVSLLDPDDPTEGGIH
jgi:hypothetical protein